jgi:hypothetical protein
MRLTRALLIRFIMLIMLAGAATPSAAAAPDTDDAG